MRSLYRAIGLCLVALSFSNLHAAIPDPSIGIDMSVKYQELLETSTTIDLNLELAPLRVIFVPGFLSDPVREFHKILKSRSKFQMGQYFDEQIRWLEKLGVDVFFVKLNSESTTEENSKIVAAAIEASPKNVLIISHSKGGLDTLEALRTHPQLQNKVHGWVTLNSPFWGTPLADAFEHNQVIRYLSNTVLGWMGGSELTIKCMTIGDRDIYQKKYDAEIRQITSRVPFISLAAWKPNVKGIDTKLEPFRNYMDGLGYQNDGAIPWQSAILPNSPYILVKGVDHISTVGLASSNIYHPVSSLKALYTMIRKK